MKSFHVHTVRQTGQPRCHLQSTLIIFNNDFYTVSIVAGDDSVATPAQNRFSRVVFKYVIVISDTRENATNAQLGRPLTLPYFAESY